MNKENLNTDYLWGSTLLDFAMPSLFEEKTPELKWKITPALHIQIKKVD